LAGESATDDVDWFDCCPVNFGYIAKVWDAGESCFEDGGWGFVELAMPDNFASDGVDDA
jgi:hypothetical protein